MRTKYEPRASATPDHDQPSAMTPITAATCTPQNAIEVTRTWPTSERVTGNSGAAAETDEAVFMPPGCQRACQAPSGLGHNQVGPGYGGGARVSASVDCLRLFRR